MTEKLLDFVQTAAGKDDATVVKQMTQLLRHGADINATRAGMQPVLHTLCAAGYGDAVALALENGAQLYGGAQSALSTAAEAANLKAVRLLIPHAASPTGSKLGYSNAIHALMNKLPGDKDPDPRPGMKADALACLTALMAAGGEVSDWTQQRIVNNYQYLLPAVPHLRPVADFMNATLAKGTAALERVLEAGLHPDLPAAYGSAAPLAWAMLKNDMDRVRLLMKYGADPDLDGRGLPTPIHKAVETNNLEALELMLAAGATGVPHDVKGNAIDDAKNLYQVAALFPGAAADAAIAALDAREEKAMATILKTMGTRRALNVQKQPVRFKPL